MPQSGLPSHGQILLALEYWREEMHLPRGSLVVDFDVDYIPDPLLGKLYNLIFLSHAH